MASHANIFCQENPKDRGTWWAIVHGFTKRHNWLTPHTCTHDSIELVCFQEDSLVRQGRTGRRFVMEAAETGVWSSWEGRDAKACRKPPELERGKEGPCYRLQGEHVSADSRFPASRAGRQSTSFCSKPHCLWFFVMAALETIRESKCLDLTPCSAAYRSVWASAIYLNLWCLHFHLWYDHNHKTNILALLQGFEEFIQGINTYDNKCRLFFLPFHF